MSVCLSCKGEVAPGWSYCGPACSGSLSTQSLSEPEERQSTEGLMTCGQLAIALGVATGSIQLWRASGIITGVQVRGSFYYKVEDVTAALIERGSTRAKNIAQRYLENRSAPKVTAPVTEQCPQSIQAAISTTPVFDRIRDMMLAAAKQAARDVCLEYADHAQAIANHELRAQMLDDFIHLEEGLQLIFTPRTPRLSLSGGLL